MVPELAKKLVNSQSESVGQLINRGLLAVENSHAKYMMCEVGM